jgi:hypothetical protein
MSTSAPLYLKIQKENIYRFQKKLKTIPNVVNAIPYKDAKFFLL